MGRWEYLRRLSREVRRDLHMNSIRPILVFILAKIGFDMEDRFVIIQWRVVGFEVRQFVFVIPLLSKYSLLIKPLISLPSSSIVISDIVNSFVIMKSSILTAMSTLPNQHSRHEHTKM